MVRDLKSLQFFFFFSKIIYSNRALANCSFWKEKSFESFTLTPSFESWLRSFVALKKSAIKSVKSAVEYKVAPVDPGDNKRVTRLILHAGGRRVGRVATFRAVARRAGARRRRASSSPPAFKLIIARAFRMAPGYHSSLAVPLSILSHSLLVCASVCVCVSYNNQGSGVLAASVAPSF